MNRLLYQHIYEALMALALGGPWFAMEYAGEHREKISVGEEVVPIGAHCNETEQQWDETASHRGGRIQDSTGSLWELRIEFPGHVITEVWERDLATKGALIPETDDLPQVRLLMRRSARSSPPRSEDGQGVLMAYTFEVQTRPHVSRSDA